LTVAPSSRLPAAQRRQAIVDAALRVFAGCSYSGATTADIAREAGVSEPLLYRHFPSKRDLYLACLDESWARLRGTVEQIVAAESDPAEWPTAIAKAVQRLKEQRLLPANMWIQALSKAGEDEEIRRYLRRHLREVHGFFADLLRRAQEAGGVPPDIDPVGEAWINLGIGLLRSVQARVGGVLSEDDFRRIAASRRAWLTGEPRPAPAHGAD
jgi:TetR/AcrR family transcriptional regulator